MLEVLEPGLLSSLQDSGRPGHAHQGIGRAGAADLPALSLANALVGNPGNACAIEMTLSGPRLRLHRAARIALTGAPLPQARCDGKPLPMWQSLWCPAGSELQLGGMPAGCRSYLAIDGGIDVEAWLGSRSTDLNAAVGPMQGRALGAGDRVPLGGPHAGPTTNLRWSLDPHPWFRRIQDHPVLRLLPGSHADALDDPSRDALVNNPFRVSADSNRVGIRLQGPRPLRLRRPLELISEGVVAGVMQLPPGGEPIILSCEHPVTGGYPRIAQLAAADLPRLAQCRPGDRLQFTWIDAPEADQLLHDHIAALDRLCADIARRLEQEA